MGSMGYKRRMRCSSRRLPAVSLIAILTLGVYVALVAVAAACVGSLPDLAASHVHHTHGADHSQLCAWSCQAMAHSGLTFAGLREESFSAMTRVIDPPGLLPLNAAPELFPSRAPPQSFPG